MTLNINNISAVSADRQVYLNQYSEWKSANPNVSTSFNVWLSAMGCGRSDTYGKWENMLEYGDDNIDGNTLSFDRYYGSSDTGGGEEELFQTTDGQIIKFDNESTYSHVNSNNVQVLTESQLASALGLQTDDDANGKAYSNITFGSNCIDVNKYSFTGLGDGVADSWSAPLATNVNYNYQELDSTTKTGRDQIKSIVNDYLDKFMIMDTTNNFDFTDIFGENQGSDFNVLFGTDDDDNPAMQITQNGSTYTGIFDKYTGATFNFS